MIKVELALRLAYDSVQVQFLLEQVYANIELNKQFKCMQNYFSIFLKGKSVLSLIS